LEGGKNQDLFLENLTLLEQNEEIKLFSTDIRTSSQRYLEPEEVYHDFNGSTHVVTKNEPTRRGRWLILGTPLSTLSNMSQSSTVLERQISSIFAKSDIGTSIGYHIPEEESS